MEILINENKIITNIITICNNINFNTLNKFVYNKGEIIHLTANETRLLEFLLKSKGKLVTKSMLINSVWGEHDLTKISDNNINVTIAKVRKKLGKSFKLQTLIGLGYVLKD